MCHQKFPIRIGNLFFMINWILTKSPLKYIIKFSKSTWSILLFYIIDFIEHNNIVNYSIYKFLTIWGVNLWKTLFLRKISNIKQFLTLKELRICRYNNYRYCYIRWSLQYKIIKLIESWFWKFYDVFSWRFCQF